MDKLGRGERNTVQKVDVWVHSKAPGEGVFVTLTNVTVGQLLNTLLVHTPEWVVLQQDEQTTFVWPKEQVTRIDLTEYSE